MFYLPGSPAGKGAKWEWAGDTDDWHTYDMEVQCLIEEAWARVRISIGIKLILFFNSAAFLFDYNSHNL